MRSEGSYSYTRNKGQVPNFEIHRRARSKGVTVSEDVTVNSIVGLMTILSQQPCSVAIEDDSLSFQLYPGGILQFWCGTNLDHDRLPSIVSRQQDGLYGSPQEHLWKNHLWKGAESFNGHVHFICSSNARILSWLAKQRVYVPVHSLQARLYSEWLEAIGNLCVRRPTTAGCVGLDHKVSGDARGEPGFLRFVLAFSTRGLEGQSLRHCQSASNSLLEVITVMVSHEHSACPGIVWNGIF